MRSQVYRCDMCGRERGESNHYLLAFFEGESIRLAPWRDGDAAQADVSHLCGSACATRKLAEWVDKTMESVISITRTEVITSFDADPKSDEEYHAEILKRAISSLKHVSKL
jgi:hypothetical protein